MIWRPFLAALPLLFAPLAFSQQQSLEQLKQEANAGSVSSQLKLAHIYETGEGVDINEDFAFKWYMSAADQGNAQAQYSVAMMYRLGKGVNQDKAKSVEWLRKAANQGNGSARFGLGIAYYNGDGVAISDERSFAWFYLAKLAGEPRSDEALGRARNEHSEAWQNMALAKLGKMLETGDEVAADPVLAAEIYRKVLTVEASPLARQTAHYQLAGMYLSGRGVSKDVVAGRDLMLSAAKENEPGAIQKVAEMYESGAFGTADYKEAAHWYGECVHFADYGCMYRLGRLYEEGKGVKLDHAEAFTLYVMASRKGQTEAEAAAEQLYPQLTDKEFNAAQKKLSEHGIAVRRKEPKKSK